MASFTRKIIKIILTVFLALSFIFAGIRLAPGDPVEKILGPEASNEEIFNYKHQLGLDVPIHTQYFNYLTNFLTGNLGDSIFKKTNVLELIKSAFFPTLFLSFTSIFISSLLGIFGGVLSAVNKGQFIDKGLRLASLIGLSFPIFSVAPILVIIFSLKLNLLPVSEWGGIKHIILPVMSLVIPLSAIIMRVTRNKFLEDKNAPWIIVLKAKGLNGLSIIYRITKVILPTVFNVIAIQLSVVLAGTMITETIFDIPGMGSLLFEGIQNRDYPLVQGVIIYVSLVYLMVYFLVDFINEKIDPRIVE